MRALPECDEVLALPRHGSITPPRGCAVAAANAQIHHVSFSRIGRHLSPHLLGGGVEHQRERVGAFAERASADGAAHRGRYARASAAADAAAFSYRSVLARGFALVRDAAGQPLRAPPE